MVMLSWILDLKGNHRFRIKTFDSKTEVVTTGIKKHLVYSGDELIGFEEVSDPPIVISDSRGKLDPASLRVPL